MGQCPLCQYDRHLRYRRFKLMPSSCNMKGRRIALINYVNSFNCSPNLMHPPACRIDVCMSLPNQFQLDGSHNLREGEGCTAKIGGFSIDFGKLIGCYPARSNHGQTACLYVRFGQRLEVTALSCLLLILIFMYRPPADRLCAGGRATKTFTEEGYFSYFCAPHCSLGMKATIVVGNPQPQADHLFTVCC